MEDVFEEKPNYRRSCIQKFIQTYKEQECLWKTSYLGYRSNHMRQKAYRKLQDILKEDFQEATVLSVVKKIDSLRACYRKEWHKTLNGSHVPRLWYYKSLSFLEDEMLKNLHRKVSDAPDVKEEEEMAVETQETQDFQPDNDLSEDECQYFLEGDISNEKDHDVTTGTITNAIEDTSNTIVTTASSTGLTVNDVFDAIGINVATKLRSLPDHTRIIAEKLINDVLYKAQLNDLQQNTFLVTPDPFSDYK